MLDKNTILDNLDSNDNNLILDTLLNINNLFPEAIDKVIKLLKHSDWSIVDQAVYVLGIIGVDDLDNVGKELMSLFQNIPNNLEIEEIENELLRNEIIESLSNLEYYPSLDLIKDLVINDLSPIVRASSAEAIGYLGSDKDIELLQKVIDSNECKSIKNYAMSSIRFIKNYMAISN